MGFLIAGAVVGLGTAIGSAVIQNQAENSAIGAQKDALTHLQSLDVNKLMDTATQADINKYKTQLDTQQKYDPVFGTMRTQGGQNIIAGLNQDASGNTIADKSLATANTSAASDSAANQPVIDALIAQAKSDLASGATLSPAFQQELIRSGLEKAGQSGEALSGSGAAGASTRTLLGSQGIALQQARTAEAKSNMSTAAALQGQRQSALEQLATLDNNLRGAKMQRGATAAQIGSSSIPSIGLSGSDAVNMNIANTNQANNITLTRGALDAQKALANGQMWSSILSSSGSAVSGVLGGMGGGGGGIGGLMGGGGGGGSSIGGGNMSSMYGGAGSALMGLLGGGSSAPAYNPNLSADANRSNNALFGLGAR
jgi:hypothetical protein